MRTLQTRVEALEAQRPACPVVLVNITDDDPTWRNKPAWAGGEPVDREALEAREARGEVVVYVLHWTNKWRDAPGAEHAKLERED